MNLKHVAWSLVIIGALVQTAESMSKSSALLNNIQYSQTSIGQVTTPIEKFLPITLGWTMIASGSLLLVVC
jgi:hypothetical protein